MVPPFVLSIIVAILLEVKEDDATPFNEVQVIKPVNGLQLNDLLFVDILLNQLLH